MNAPLLALSGVAVAHRGRVVLAGADLVVHAGDRVALVGENGAGKSTLLQAAVGLHPLQAGHVSAFGEPCRDERGFRALRRRVGLLFQDSDDQLFCPTVIEDVAFGPLNLGLPAAEARRRAEQTLSMLGLADFAPRVTHRLSGGEKRLVALATVLAMKPEVLLLDEPTNGLDERTERRVVEYLDGLPIAMVLVSHDQRLLGRLAKRAVVLRDGRTREGVLHVHPHTHVHEHAHVHLPEADDHGQPVPAHRHDHG